MKILLYVFLIFSFCSNAQVISDKCLDFDVYNYKEVLKDGVSGLYINPLLDNHCFFISFNRDDKLNYNDLKTNDPYIRAKFELFRIKSGMDVYQKLSVDKKTLFKFFKFDKESLIYKKFRLVFDDFKTINKYYEDFLFLHETFHLIPMRIAKEDDEYLYEVYSDIAAIFVISEVYGLNSNETNDMIESMSILRPRFLHLKFDNSHHNKVYNKVIDYIKNNGMFSIEATTMRDAYSSVLKIVK